MELLNYYEKVKYEVSILENRLEILKQYEQSILDEKSKLETIVYFQKKLINQIEYNLKACHGIEYKLFHEIMINGLSVTKAIEKVAYEEDKDVSTLWKYYYPKVKGKIAELQALKVN